MNIIREKNTEILLYDDIGPEWAGMISAEMVTDALEQFSGKPTTLRINSDGGDVFHASTMGNAIERHGNVTAVVDGIAASAAAYLTTRAKTVVMAQNSMLMVHDPWTVGVGNARDFRDLANILDKIGGAWLSDYTSRSGKSQSEIVDMLANDTWMTADEAKNAGFVDEIGNFEADKGKVAASMTACLAKIKAIATRELNPSTESGQRDRIEQAYTAPVRTAALLRARMKAKL